MMFYLNVFTLMFSLSFYLGMTALFVLYNPLYQSGMVTSLMMIHPFGLEKDTGQKGVSPFEPLTL